MLALSIFWYLFMSIITRGQVATAGDIIQLTTTFRDPITGELVDLNSFPQISIQQPSGNVISSWTSVGVYHLSTGIYGYDLSVGSIPELGVWNDEWRGEYGSNVLFNSHNFVIYNTQMPATNSDGYVHLGDEPGFDYSQAELKNINKLIALLRARLNSAGKAMVKDEYGNDQLIDCDIFTIPQLALFLEASLSGFNEFGHFTDFTWDNYDFVRRYAEILVRGGLIYALSSKALIERGREFNISDNGVTFQPPGVSDMLNTQYSTEYSAWREDVKQIKAQMKPSPMGLGGLRPLAASPAYLRLRHLRAGRLY